MRWVNDVTVRYLEAHLVEDLFNSWTLITVWGGQGSPRGRMRSTGVESYEDGRKQLEKIGKRRRQRGYRLVNVESPLRLRADRRIPLSYAERDEAVADRHSRRGEETRKVASRGEEAAHSTRDTEHATS
jgi:hypothetical protein